MIEDFIQAARQGAREIQESLYPSLCTVYGFRDVEKPNGATSQEEVCYIIDEPCKLSKKALTTSNQTDAENTISFVPQLFLSPDVEIVAGSRVVVMQARAGSVVKTMYEQTGIPVVYDTHQEVMMQLSKRKA